MSRMVGYYSQRKTAQYVGVPRETESDGLTGGRRRSCIRGLGPLRGLCDDITGEERVLKLLRRTPRTKGTSGILSIIRISSRGRVGTSAKVILSVRKGE